MRIMGSWRLAADNRASASPFWRRRNFAMFFLRQVFAAAVAAVFFGQGLAAETAERQFEALARLPDADVQAMAGQMVEVDIDLAASSGFDVEVRGERAEARYRMAFNQVAEGWSWRPQADPAVADYYRYKFLPLQSVAVERGSYEHEDKIGVHAMAALLGCESRVVGYLDARNIEVLPRHVEKIAIGAANFD